MESRSARLIVIGLLIAAAVALFVVLKDDEGDSEPTSTTSTTETTGTSTAPPPAPEPDVIRLRGGAPVGGVQRLTYTSGEVIRLQIRLDGEYEEVHVHGYELLRENVSGVQNLKFEADLEGIYEVEAHGAAGDVLLAELEVRPG